MMVGLTPHPCIGRSAMYMAESITIPERTAVIDNTN